jgi:hypothetical protein
MRLKLFEEVNEDWLYMQLHMFKRGIVSETQIKRADDLIYDIKKNGIITLKFDNNNDYFKLFKNKLSNDDIFIMDQIFNSYYGSMEFFDSYRANEDWECGYIVSTFNESNMDKVKEISMIISPGIDFEDYASTPREDFSQKLNNFFPRIVEDIINEYSSSIDTAIKDYISNYIEKDICDAFYNYGIYNSNYCFYKYHTTVDNLIKLYDTFGEKSKPLVNLLKKIADLTDIEGNYWEEYIDATSSVNFDSDSFNNYVGRKLDDIIERLEEDSEMFLSINEYKNIVKKLSKKYNFNRWYDLPKDKKIMFKITHIDPGTNKINFEVKNQNGFYRNSLNLENFNLFLHHPEIKFED